MAKRMKGHLFFLLITILFLQGAARAQVLMIPQIQSSGVIPRQEVWTVLINNMSGELKNAVLSISITDQATAQRLMEANSAPLSVSTGVRRISFNDWAPVSYLNASMDFGTDRSATPFFPVGEYLICYQLTESTGKHIVLANECVKVTADPLSPPQLITPENTAIVMEQRPLFTWIPPAPLSIFNNLDYEVIISPLYNKQSPQEAVQRNVPVATTISSANSLQYPASFTDLQPGKTYVWQVLARDGLKPGGRSEVFTFTVMPDSVAKIISQAPYIKLNITYPQVTIMHQGVLKMEYFNTGSDTTVKIEAYLLSEGNSRGKKQISFQLPVKPGQNFLEYRIDNRIRLDESAIYGVRLLNSKGETWYMRFNPKYYF